MLRSKAPTVRPDSRSSFERVCEKYLRWRTGQVCCVGKEDALLGDSEGTEGRGLSSSGEGSGTLGGIGRDCVLS
jgi:hypothetical protein